MEIENDSNFWNLVEKFDVVEFTETWIEEKDWKSIKSKLPCSSRGELQATRGKERHRSSGGIMTGVRINLEEREWHRI